MWSAYHWTYFCSPSPMLGSLAVMIVATANTSPPSVPASGSRRSNRLVVMEFPLNRLGARSLWLSARGLTRSDRTGRECYARVGECGWLRRVRRLTALAVVPLLGGLLVACGGHSKASPQKSVAQRFLDALGHGDAATAAAATSNEA